MSPTEPRTTIRYERSVILSVARLEHEDGGHAVVYCAIPGGRPRFQFGEDDAVSYGIDEAPTIERHGEFVRFVEERFGGEETGQ